MDDWGRHLALDMNFDQVVSIALQELEGEGFEVSGQLDVRDALRRSLDEEFRRYTILSVWHPAVALQAFRQSLDIGVELLVNMAIYELPNQETAITVAEPLPSLSGDRSWRDECPELLPIEVQFANHLARVLSRMSHRTRAAVAVEQRS